MALRAKAALVALVLLACALGTTLRRDAMVRALSARTYEDVYYLPDDRALRPLSLGYTDALADLIWLKALVYTGDSFANHGSLVHVFRYADAMLTLDPYFRAAYSWVGTMGVYRVTEVSLDDHRQTVAFLERGVRTFPNDGDMHWDLGAMLAYELAPRLPPGPEKTRVLAQASEQLQTAARLGAGPPWLALTNATQLVRAGQTERAVEHLLTMHALTSDPSIRAQIEARIVALRAESEMLNARNAYEAFEAERRQAFPYVPDTLYMLLRPRVRPRAD